MTNTGRPFAYRLAPTRSAFDIPWRGSASGGLAAPLAALAVAGGAATALPGLSAWRPLLYGNLRDVVVNESASLRSARSRQAAKPGAGPNLVCRPLSSRDDRTSLPPAFPNTAPISEAAAATSLRVHGLALFFVFL